jgi:ribosomal protein L32
MATAVKDHNGTSQEQEGAGARARARARARAESKSKSRSRSKRHGEALIDRLTFNTLCNQDSESGESTIPNDDSAHIP